MIQTHTQERSSKQVVSKAGIDAVDLLKSQHQEVSKLFKKFDHAGENSSKDKFKIYKEIATMLMAHTKIEEDFLYPAGKPIDLDMTMEAFEEHALIKEMISKTNSIEPSDESFHAKVKVLKELVEHHVGEEEDTYFPELRKSLGKDKLMELGSEMKEEFDSLVKEGQSKLAH